MGDCFDFLQNNTLSRADLNLESGSARNIHYGDILIKFGDCLGLGSDKLPFVDDESILSKYVNSTLRVGDIIFADTAEDESAGKCVELVELPNEPVISGLHTIPVRPKFPFGSGYLGHYLNAPAYHDQLLPLMQGIKVISVSKTALQDTQICFPSVSEQFAIGASLNALDFLITLHQRKRCNGPFTHPLVWEQRKLGELARRVTRKNAEHESDLPLTISAQYGLVDQRTFFNSQVASKDMSGYYLLRKGEFAYNKSTSTDSPWGAIKQLVKYDKGCVSTLYICFELLEADPDYLVAYYETDRWHKAVQLVAAEGARNHGLLNISPDDFFETQLTLPMDKAEQECIGKYFSSLDNLITLHQ